jgi:hypothetical protein
MADIETDGPVIRRFMNRLAVTAVLVAQRTSIGSTPDTDAIRTMRQRRCCGGPFGRDAWVRAHQVNLAGLFWISPIAAAENGRTRLQEGQIVSIKNQKAKIDQFKRSFP